MSVGSRRNLGASWKAACNAASYAGVPRETPVPPYGLHESSPTGRDGGEAMSLADGTIGPSRRIWIGLPDGADHELWRYMDFVGFVDLLQRHALWFTRLDQFKDPYEGFLTKPTAEFFAQVRSRTGFRGGVNQENWRRVHCVNCWSMREYESAAMWDLYSKEAGVAIRSRISRIEHSFPPEVTGGSWAIAGDAVRYVDYENENVARLDEDGSVLMTADFLCKRKSFEHEQEYRLTTTLEDDECDLPGKFIPVILDQLIETVVVSPTAPNWVAGVIRHEVGTYSLDVEVVRSDLYNPMPK